MSEAFFYVRDLVMYYRTRKGPVKAVDNVSFYINEGETIAIIGESGCGKTSVARSIMRLLPRNVLVYKGTIALNGTNLMGLSDEEFRREVMWNKITYVPQAALNSLNPVIKVKDQMIEPLIMHRKMDKESALEIAVSALKKVGISEDFIHRYPFELSGGMKQRVIIAMALMVSPKLMILDEPTSSLDMLTQANIMNLLKEIKRSAKMSMIFITHDISLSSELADKVAVMYAGQIVEFNDANGFYVNPLHPYSQKLMGSVPTLRSNKKIDSIPGAPPSLINPPKGCRFRERCSYASDKCMEDPPLVDVKNNFYVRCWLYERR